MDKYEVCLLRSAGGLERIRAGLVYMHLLRSTYYVVLVVLERIRAGLVYQVYHPRKGGESGAGSVQSQTSHILAHT